MLLLAFTSTNTLAFTILFFCATTALQVYIFLKDGAGVEAVVSRLAGPGAPLLLWRPAIPPSAEPGPTPSSIHF